MSKIAMTLALAAAIAMLAAKPTATVTVRGRVVDPDGKPIEGARLYWPRLPKAQLRSDEDVELLQRTKTDADGRFHFQLPRSDIHPELPFAVLAAADGYGVDWTELAKEDAPAELTLRLVKDQPIEGRILSSDGKPLAGVRVRAVVANKPPTGKIDDFLAAWKQDWHKAYAQQSEPPHSMLLPQDEKCFQAATDNEGRFRIRGTGAERLVLLRLRGSGITPAVLFVVARAGFDAAPLNKIVRSRATPQERRLGHPLFLYGPSIEYTAPPARRIEGTVREVGTGKAIPGFVIQCPNEQDDGVRCVADKQGRYHLDNLPQRMQYQLFASPPDKSSWLQTSATVDDTGGTQPLRLDFNVARGVVVSGRVHDKANLKGIRSFVHFVALPGNKFFDKPSHAAYRRQRLAVSTDADGSFRLAVFPGPGVLMAQATVLEKANGQMLKPYKRAEMDAKDRKSIKVRENDNGDSFFTAADNTLELLTPENAVKLLDLAANAGPTKCDLFADRGVTRLVRIEDADGKPLMGTTVAGLTASWPNTFPIKDAVCMVFALDPNKPRRLLFLYAKRNLAGTLTLYGDDKQPVVVRLERTAAVKGRVLDRDGKPLAGADVNLILSDPTGFELYRVAGQRPTIRTDKDGRFRMEGIVPDLKFTLGITQRRAIFVAEPRLGVKQIKAGETLNLGDLRVTPAR